MEDLRKAGEMSSRTVVLNEPEVLFDVWCGQLQMALVSAVEMKLLLHLHCTAAPLSHSVEMMRELPSRCGHLPCII